MKKKTIYLIRHGETDFNKKGAVQGRGIDAPLNETGQKQAGAFFDKYKEVPFEKIYISSLIRTRQTVQDFINQGIPVESYVGLDEISWGTAEGKTLQELGVHFFRDLLEKWNSGETDYAPEKGESPEDVVIRQAEVMNIILNRKDENLILIAMHGRAIRILLSYLFKQPLSKMEQFRHHNTSLYILEYDYDTEEFKILLNNDMSHLT